MQAFKAISIHPYSQQHYSQSLKVDTTQMEHERTEKKMWCTHTKEYYTALKRKNLHMLQRK